MLSSIYSAFIGCIVMNAVVSVTALGFDQAVGVKGMLLCNGQPARDVLIKLYDEDTFDPDDLLASTNTDKVGRFQLNGYTDEVTSIEPKVNFYHDCNDELMPCQRKVSIYVPSDYVASGKYPNQFYDVGSIELSGKFKGESRDCIHRIKRSLPEKH